MIKTILRNWQLLAPLKNRIGYVGWLGENNIGDEAMYLAVKELFSNFVFAPFKYTNKIEKFEKISKRKIFTTVFLGGGTLINNNEYLKLFRIAQEHYGHTFIFGTGVRNPQFWNRMTGEENLLDWSECLRKSAFVGVRGPLSKQILDDSGFDKSEIIGDPALSLAKDKPVKKNRQRKIGINIGVSRGNVWGSEETILNFIVKFAKILLNENWQITFLPTWKQDILYIEEVAKQVGGRASIFYKYNSITETMDFLEQCDLFVGEKLHSVVLALCVYTPSVMLEYRPKCLDFMMSMGLENYNMRTDELSLDLIKHLTEILYQDLEQFQNHIAGKIIYYKQIQKEKSKIISGIINEMT